MLGDVFRFWSLIYGRPLTLTLSHGGERGQSFGCRSIAASLFGFARAKLVILFSYKIQRRRCRQTIGRPGGFW